MSATNAPLRHTAVLPHGFRATFEWEPPPARPDVFAMNVRWHPGVPHIHSARHRRKFLAAYQAARREFLTMIATIIGGNVLVADTNAAVTELTELEVVQPAVRH
jgi:hypothetical protein